MIGSYNENGQKEGPWGTFNTYDQDFKDKVEIFKFYQTGCHVETALDTFKKRRSLVARKNAIIYLRYYLL